jgi:FMN phosphatase YigB (HAD superfamily)
MPSQPIPGSSGEILADLPSAYQPHADTGLLHLPRFLAKCAYVKQHGSLPASYAKNYQRGMDRFLCLHLGVDPAAVEKIVHECLEAGRDEAERDRRLRALFPAELRVAKWNRSYVQKGMTPNGREFIKEALTAMGCADRVDQIVSVVDLIEFDEGRLE